MTEQEKKEILEKAKIFFREHIGNNHIRNVKKLTKLASFDYNPFLLEYLANFLTGNGDPKSMAKTLIYPRVLGTSINTSFGTHMQRFCSTALSGFGSVVPGIDIEFTDHVDKRKKYCQTKLGTQTINFDDIETIRNHFQKVINLARTNSLDVRVNDLVVGVFYGTKEQLSSMYTNVMKDYTVYVGEEFWYRLTGDEKFYIELIDTFGEVAKDTDGKDLLEEVINELAEDIQKKYMDKGLL